MKKALIFGATGLIGGELLKLLIQKQLYHEVVCFVRKEIKLDNPKFRFIKTDYTNLSDHTHEFKNTDVYCCLGTTIKKVNYDKEAFKKVDLYLPLEIAQLGSSFGANQFLVISSLGANTKSRFFYSRVKGILQEKLREIKLPAIHIFQPSVLVGDRNDFRLGEKMSAAVLNGFKYFLSGKLIKYMPIKAYDVAVAMITVAFQHHKGYFIYPSHKIQTIANDTTKGK